MTGSAFVLATDLDGTFLGGSEAQRQALYEHLRGREDVLLVFVTGRDIAFIADLIRMPGIPRPRYIIADVGTSIYDAWTLEPIAELEAEIAARWGASTPRVMARLDGEPGLTLQPTPFRYRVSYDCDPALLSPRTIAELESCGFQCLLSAGRFLDVLPAGVAKGPTLMRLARALGHERVLVAGDTMNDLSLFQTGFDGVAVSNSEPRLLEAVARLSTVYCSPLPGAAGIFDALHHYNLAAGGVTR